MELDASNNIYITGYYGDTIDFGNGISRTSRGESDIFLAKYNTDGVVQWAKSDVGTLADKAFAMAIDIEGVYVTGEFYGLANFGSSGTISKTALGEADIFLLKYSLQGVLQWVRTDGSINYDTSKDICLNEMGVFICGTFSGTATFGSSNNLTSRGKTDVFLIEYTKNGTFTWGKNYGGVDGDFINGMELGQSNSVILYGYFDGTSTWTGKTIVSHGTNDGYIARIDIEGAGKGDVNQLYQLGGLGSDAINHLYLDSNNDAYITGNFDQDAQYKEYLLSEVFTFKIPNPLRSGSFALKQDFGYANIKPIWLNIFSGKFVGSDISVYNGYVNLFGSSYFLESQITVGNTTLTTAGDNNSDTIFIKIKE